MNFFSCKVNLLAIFPMAPGHGDVDRIGAAAAELEPPAPPLEY
jgi:hypothetical protein